MGLLDPILGSLGLSLWNMEFQKHGPSWLLRVYIDREESGVTLNDCEVVSRDLGAALDVEDIIPHTYTLEVSSPGLDRTLSKPEHFVRLQEVLVKIKTYQQINGQKVFTGNYWPGRNCRTSRAKQAKSEISLRISQSLS
jgi:ribosome maturation factor RimP